MDYIFPLIEKKLAQLEKEHPNQKVFNLGVGDVCLPLAPTVAKAICDATVEMTEKPRGYGPCGGYPFLKEAICTHDYAPFGISPDEIFISDGANTDVSSIQELFPNEAIAAVTDPTYPVYRNATLLAGKKVLTIPLKEEEGFIPKPPKDRADFVYLCTPSNPTGIALNHAQLNEWIVWAKKRRSILLIDNVYNAFISSEDIPSSIYALDGAKEVAIEIRSFSKWAGFTGLRCGYMVVPKGLHLPDMHARWAMRTEVKTNGVAYPIQRGAEACFSPHAKEELSAQIETYRSAAALLRNALEGQTFFGGLHSPYIWWKTPEGVSSWEFFDTLLERSRIIAIPGKGFGNAGEGFVRLSCFLSPELAKEAADALHHHFATA